MGKGLASPSVYQRGAGGLSSTVVQAIHQHPIPTDLQAAAAAAAASFVEFSSTDDFLQFHFRQFLQVRVFLHAVISFGKNQQTV